MVKNKITYLAALLLFLYSCDKEKEKNTAQVYYKKINNSSFPVGVKIDGLKQGLWIEYDSLGIIRSSESFLNGVSHGELRLFNEIGEVTQIIDIENGKFNGNYQILGKGGSIIAKGQYLNNKKTGYWFYFEGTNGKMTKKEFWNNGVLIN